MTGTKQRTRRLDDMGTVIEGLAQQIVDDRAERDRQIREVVNNVNAVLEKGWAAQQKYIDTADRLIERNLERQIVALRDRSFWQRLHWLFLGA